MAGYEILFLDDESWFLHNLARVLRHEGFQVTIKSNDLPEHYPHLDIANFDLIAGRVISPFDNLKVLFEKFKKLNPNGAVIVLSKDYDYTFPVEAFQLKIDDYILMPSSLCEVSHRLIRCLNEVKLRYLTILSYQTVSEVNRRAFKCLIDSDPLRLNFMPEVKALLASGFKIRTAFH